jgi:TonB family protein
MDRKTSIKGNSPSILPEPRKIMRFSLVVSLLFHVCILLGIQKTFPIDWGIKPLRTYHIELIRPPVDPLDDGKTSGNDLSVIKSQEKAPPEKTEDTISLDTKDERYVSYARVIKEKLMNNWTYPRQAWENLIEGEVLVYFTLNREGHLRDLKLLKPSVFGILNGEAARAVRAAAPFPPFPGSVTVKKLNIKANFAYRLTSRR